MSDEAELDRALESAHLPALLAAMVHITGDADWVKPEWTPVYVPLSRGETGLAPEVQAEIRAKAKTVIQAYLANGEMKAPTPELSAQPSVATIPSRASIPTATRPG